MNIHNSSDRYKLNPDDLMYRVENVLEDNGCEARNADEGFGSFSNFFITPDSTVDGYIIFDMGCEVLLTTIDFRNTHGGRYHE